MFASIAVVAVVLAVPESSNLLRADFDASAAPLEAKSTLSCAGGVASLAPGVATALSAPGPFVGDLAIELDFEDAFAGELAIELLGSPDLELRIGASQCSLRSAAKQVEAAVAAPFRACVVRLRSHAVELLLDGVPTAFAEFTRPIGGGSLAIEIAPSTAVRLDRVLVDSIPFPARDVIEGLDPARLARLAALPLASFRLLDPVVSRLDPVYRLGVEGEDTPIVVHGRGIRLDAAELPLLEQALAIARIRPWLDFQLIEGEARPEDKPLARREPAGPYVITTAPGAIRVRALCGMTDQWPVVVVMDATRDRVLVRFNPGGPSAGEAWSLIPSKCNRIRVALVVPEGPTIEHFVDLVRP